jgi:hypothetical protein
MGSQDVGGNPVSNVIARDILQHSVTDRTPGERGIHGRPHSLSHFLHLFFQSLGADEERL